MNIKFSAKDILIISNLSECTFASDVSHFFGKHEEVSDIIALKQFANSEFCPRFISNPQTPDQYGKMLTGKCVVIVSTHTEPHHNTRNEIAMRNFIVARAAKDNGAEKVMLLEPDLFYSAQDRGPQKEHGHTQWERTDADRYKFNGQPFTAKMYADLLKSAGVDTVATIHNHAYSTQMTFKEVFGEENFINIIPNRLYAKYLITSRIVSPERLVLCAPDHGAASFVESTRQSLQEMFGIQCKTITLEKERTDEDNVSITLSKESEMSLKEIEGKDIVIIDDMVRTGDTIAKCCDFLVTGKPRQNIFMVTHFHTSETTRKKLATNNLNEIITTNTIPTIMNGDSQGRLRQKLAVLKIGRWLAYYLKKEFDLEGNTMKGKWYKEDLSSRNPRSKFNYYVDADTDEL